MTVNQPCECEDTSNCNGVYTAAETVMVELRPEFSLQHYHAVLSLFDTAYDVAYSRANDDT